MFKFNFDTSNPNDEAAVIPEPQSVEELAPSLEVMPTDEPSSLQWDAIDLSDSVVVLKGRVTDADASKALNNLEVLNSDLIPGKYEGGFKLWEGGVDLARYLVDNVFPGPCDGPMRVLELGCGHGLPGIVALLAGAAVDFQDYNEEVLHMLTAPTVAANWRTNRSQDAEAPPARYFAGDWGTLGPALAERGLGAAYDIILTTETIYTLEGMDRLFQCIKQCLKKPSGVCYVGAKSFYFGVGGGVAAFADLVRRDGEMTSEVVEVLEDGRSNKREILALRWQGSAAL